MANHSRFPNLMATLSVAGSRTGLEAGAVPTKGGVVMDMSKMNKVILLHKEDMQVPLNGTLTLRGQREFSLKEA